MLKNHVDELDTIFANMAVPLANNILGEWLGVIRRGTYQEASEDSRWAYEPFYDLWTDIDTDGDSSDYGSSDKGIKDQEKLDDQE